MPQLFLKTPLCNMVLTEQEGAITALHFCGAQAEPFNDSTPLLNQAADELGRYLKGELKQFTVPVRAVGTPFMQRVWAELEKVPYGATVTYRELAEAAGSPKGFRAAGMACNRNPVPIFIPCHRIVGTNGSLTGYAGGLDIKSRLLALEQSGLLPAPEGAV